MLVPPNQHTANHFNVLYPSHGLMTAPSPFLSPDKGPKAPRLYHYAVEAVRQ